MPPSSEPSPSRVAASAIRLALVVDDLEPTRAWLCRALHETFVGLQVTQAASLNEAQAALRGELPDLALVDLRLPDGNGSELIRSLRRQRADALILVPTIFDDDAHVLDALRAGADGYLLKDLALPRLASALRQQAEGEPALSPALARRLLRMNEAGTLPLSTDEQALLRQRARGASAIEAAQAMRVSAGDAAGLLRAIYARLRQQPAV